MTLYCQHLIHSINITMHPLIQLQYTKGSPSNNAAVTQVHLILLYLELHEQQKILFDFWSLSSVHPTPQPRMSISQQQPTGGIQ